VLVARAPDTSLTNQSPSAVDSVRWVPIPPPNGRGCPTRPRFARFRLGIILIPILVRCCATSHNGPAPAVNGAPTPTAQHVPPGCANRAAPAAPTHPVRTVYGACRTHPERQQPHRRSEAAPGH